MNIRDRLQEMYPDVPLLFMIEEVFDKAIIGVSERIGDEPSVAYDYDKVIEANIEMGMSYEEAIEYFSVNQIGAYMGEHTPVFITKLDEE